MPVPHQSATRADEEQAPPMIAAQLMDPVPPERLEASPWQQVRSTMSRSRSQRFSGLGEQLCIARCQWYPDQC